jgi:RNA polymerase sigma-70 factor (ECF subfamily)
LHFQEKVVQANGLHEQSNMENNHDHLIRGLRAGNRQVFEEIFNTWYDPLVRYCMQRLYSQEDAEEIVQDIFIKLWVRRAELNYSPSIKSYLYRTALNKIINFKEHQEVRNTHRTHVLAASNSVSSESGSISTKEIQWLAAEAVNSMPKKRKMVYELSRRDGLSYAEIAEKMGVSVKTVEAHLTAALVQLRTHLKDYLPALAFLIAMFL